MVECFSVNNAACCCDTDLRSRSQDCRESTLNALPIHAKDYWRVWLPSLTCPRAWQCVCSNIILRVWNLVTNVAFFRSDRLAKIFRGCTLHEIVRSSIKHRATAMINRCSPDINFKACQMCELHYPLHIVVFAFILLSSFCLRSMLHNISWLL